MGNCDDAPLESKSFDYRTAEADFRHSWNSELGFFENDRRLVFSRQASFQQQSQEPPHTPVSINLDRPFLSRTVSCVDVPPVAYPPVAYPPEEDGVYGEQVKRFSVLLPVSSVFRLIRSGSKPMKRLLMLISLNVACSTAELCIGLLSGRVGLVSDAFHLTFGCGVLSFSLFAMAASREKPDCVYTYGYKRLEVLSAFTNALFLLFLSFSLAVEALHAFIQDESEHKHYLVVSAVANLMVNLIGVWFFRSYARINLVYRKAEDMNYHSVCLHVIADSIRSAGLILASWFLTLGVKNAEVLCLGLVSVAVFMLVMPLFIATGSILLQMAPPSIPSSALSKCLRQISASEDVLEVSQARFWELVPGHVVGSVSLQVRKGIDDRPILQFVHGLYHDVGVQELTVQSYFA